MKIFVLIAIPLFIVVFSQVCLTVTLLLHGKRGI